MNKPSTIIMQTIAARPQAMLNNRRMRRRRRTEEEEERATQHHSNSNNNTNSLRGSKKVIDGGKRPTMRSSLPPNATTTSSGKGGSNNNNNNNNNLRGSTNKGKKKNMRSSMPNNINNMNDTRSDDDGAKTESSEENNNNNNNNLGGTTDKTATPSNQPTPASSAPPTAPSSAFTKGSTVYYQTSSTLPCPFVAVRILDVHHDDMLVPYYTILRSDNGVEKQTDGCRLRLHPPPDTLDTEEPKKKDEHDTTTTTAVDDKMIDDEEEGGGDTDSGPTNLEDLIDCLALEDSGRVKKEKVEKEVAVVVRCCEACGGEITVPKKEEGQGPMMMMMMGGSQPQHRGGAEGVPSKDICGKCKSLADEVKTPIRSPTRRKASSQPRHHSLSLQPTGRHSREATGHQPHAKSFTYDRRVTIDSVDSHRQQEHLGFNHNQQPNDQIILESPPKSSIDPEPSPYVHPRGNDARRRVNRNRARRVAQKGGNFSASLPPTRSPKTPVELMKQKSVNVLGAQNASSRQEDITPHGHPPQVDNKEVLAGETIDDSIRTVLKRRHTRETEPESCLHSSTESNDNAKQLADNLVLSSRKVDVFRCHDSNGVFGFYSGMVVSSDKGEDLPNGKGQMTYDDGHIEKGVWVQGLLKMNVGTDQDRYEPDVLPGYSVGDIGRYDDMEKATMDTASKLHIGDCGFIRRSTGKWSYALVKSRSDIANNVSITFLASAKGSTKTIAIHKWVNHIRLPKRAISIPGYKVGDYGREEDMMVCTEDQTMRVCQQLRIDDAAWVKRSNGSYTYAIVIDRTEGDDAKITFEIDSKGSTKSIQVSRSWKRICGLRQRGDGNHSKEIAEVLSPNLVNNALIPQDQDKQVMAGQIDDVNKVPSGEDFYQSWHTPSADERNLKQHSAQASSFYFEGPQALQQVYDGLGERQEENSVGSVQSQDQGPSYLGIKYTAQTSAISGDDNVLTDDMTASLAGTYSTLTDDSEGKIKQRLLRRIISRQKRRSSSGVLTDDGDDSIDAINTLPGNFVACEEEGTPDLRWGDEDGGYSSLSDASKGNASDRKRDRLLMHLIAQAAMEDANDGEKSLDISLDESLASLKNSFLKWRQNKVSSDDTMLSTIDVKQRKSDKERKPKDKKKSKERKKRSDKHKDGKKYDERKTPQTKFKRRETS